jgi:hypothetical protein
MLSSLLAKAHGFIICKPENRIPKTESGVNKYCASAAIFYAFLPASFPGKNSVDLRAGGA